MQALALFAVPATFASADVAFDDFGPGNSGLDYQTDHGWRVSGDLTTFGLTEEACQFTASVGGTVSDIVMPMSFVSGTGAIQIQLFDDSAGEIGPTLLESWTMGTTGPFSSYNAPATLTGDGSASLTALSDYWLVASVVDGSSSSMWAVWNTNNTGLITPRAFYSAGTWSYINNPGNTTGAFNVDVVPPNSTPEPFTIALGIAGVGIAIRRRIRA